MKANQILALVMLTLIFLIPFEIFGQVSGNIAFDKPYYKKSKLSGNEQKVYLSDSTMLIRAKVLINVLSYQFSQTILVKLFLLLV